MFFESRSKCLHLFKELLPEIADRIGEDVTPPDEEKSESEKFSATDQKVNHIGIEVGR